MNCIYYKGCQYCSLHESRVASAYCGDLCKDKKEDIIMKNELPEMTKDELGGLHDGVVGYNPQGIYCGECANVTCKGCNYEKADE